jgi:hypothetical protein
MSDHWMELTMRLAVLLCLSSAFGFAETWSGYLVDSKCYANEEGNVNPTDTLTNVDRDRGFEVRYCSPNAKTKSFAIVRTDGQTLKLDAGGNAKAADMVRKIGKKPLLAVAVTGERNKNTITVDTISVAK